MQLIAWHGALRKAEKAKRKNNIHNNKNSGLSRNNVCSIYKIPQSEIRLVNWYYGLLSSIIQ